MESGEKTVGKLLRWHRLKSEDKEMRKLKTAARTLAVNNSTLTKIENGSKMPEAQQLIDFSRQLKLSDTEWRELWLTYCEEFPRHAMRPRPIVKETPKNRYFNANLIKYLRYLYGNYVHQAGGILVERHGLEYAAAFFPVLGEPPPLTSVLPKERVNVRHRARITDKDLVVNNPEPRRRRNELREHKLTESEMTRGWNLCFSELSMDSGYPVLSARLANFGSIIDSTDALTDEIVTFFSATSPSVDQYPTLLEYLPWRRRLHRYISEHNINPFTRAPHCAAGIGVSLSVSYRVENYLAAILEQRSNSVEVYQGYHDVPSAMLGWRFSHQEKPDGTRQCPWGSYQDKDIQLAAYAIYAAEVLGDPVPNTHSRSSVEYHPRIRKLIDDYAPYLAYLGVAFDLCTLRPEIACALIITNPDWYDTERPRPNGGFLPHPPYERITRFIGIKNDEGSLHAVLPDRTTPAGAAVFWAGVDAARKMWEKRGTS